MITLNNKIYKLVYLDTNALSEFVNNTKGFTKNFLLKFIDGKHMLVTSVFNIVELYATQLDFKEKMKESLGIMPLGLLTSLEQICYYEKENIYIGNRIIDFAIGIKPIFNLNINDLFSILENPTTKIVAKQRTQRFAQDLTKWKKIRINKNEKWQVAFESNLKTSMQEIANDFPDPLKISDYTIFKSLQICAYTKNMFINNSSKDLVVGSVIDSYNSAYLPYVDVYISERTVGAWLDNSKSKFSFIKERQIHKISDFFDQNI